VDQHLPGMMVLSLSSLLAEVSISTRSLRQGLEHLIQKER
jgi:hypothetical protein